MLIYIRSDVLRPPASDKLPGSKLRTDIAWQKPIQNTLDYPHRLLSSGVQWLVHL